MFNLIYLQFRNILPRYTQKNYIILNFTFNKDTVRFKAKLVIICVTLLGKFTFCQESWHIDENIWNFEALRNLLCTCIESKLVFSPHPKYTSFIINILQI